jgi:aerobic carbon-monoxide dehydrogenase small subunit
MPWRHRTAAARDAAETPPSLLLEIPCAREYVRHRIGDRPRKEAALSRIAITVNGTRHELDVEPRELLVYVLRERLGLTGTNVGCDTSQCGACTVHLNGRSVKACTVLGVQADEGVITTIEGLASNGELHAVQEAFTEHHALQCGFCTPGMIMTAVELIDSGGDLSDEAIRRGLEGNLCRCTGYENIVRAIRAAADQAIHEVTR